VNKNAKAYALSGITRCAHCERLAQQNNNLRLLSLLWGPRGIYYRHKPGGACGCQRKSVQREIYEGDFFRLVKLLEVKPEAIEQMKTLALQVNTSMAEEKDLETQKAEEIALCRRSIQAAIDLYGDGRIDRAEYQRRVERNEREIVSWEARTNDSEKLAVE
jgi:hypothetical protein